MALSRVALLELLCRQCLVSLLAVMLPVEDQDDAWIWLLLMIHFYNPTNKALLSLLVLSRDRSMRKANQPTNQSINHNQSQPITINQPAGNSIANIPAFFLHLFPVASKVIQSESANDNAALHGTRLSTTEKG